MGMTDNSISNSANVTVLIIDDERAITDAYAGWLEDAYDVRTANTGPEAIDKLDEDVDIVILDRRLPDIAGEELLSEIRSRNMDCRVAIVSAVEPDFDIIELGFDIYLEKPVPDATTLREAIATLVRRSRFDAKIREFLSLATKKATLESKKGTMELSKNAEYVELVEQVAELRTELWDVTDELDNEDLRVEFVKNR